KVAKRTANPRRYALVVHAVQMHGVAIVSGKQFIPSIASKRDCYVLAGNAADVIGRDHGGVAKGLLHHACQVVECFRDVWFNYEFMMLGSELLCDRASIRSFVEVLLPKTDRERLHWRTTRA